MKLFEKTLSQEYKYKGKILNLRVDKAELEDGSTALREVIEHNGGVCVAAIDGEGKLLMVRQFRYPYGEAILEIPAGKLEKGEEPIDCGKRELKEETGFVAEELVSLGQLYPTPAYDSEVIHMYFAKNIKEASRHLDEGEFLDVEKIPFDKAVQMVLEGEIKDAKTQVAILKLKEML